MDGFEGIAGGVEAADGLVAVLLIDGAEKGEETFVGGGGLLTL